MPRDSAIGYDIDSFSKGGKSQAQLGLVLFHLTKILYDNIHRALSDTDSDGGTAKLTVKEGRCLRSQIEVMVLQSLASDCEGLICDRKSKQQHHHRSTTLGQLRDSADEQDHGDDWGRDG